MVTWCMALCTSTLSNPCFDGLYVMVTWCMACPYCSSPASLNSHNRPAAVPSAKSRDLFRCSNGHHFGNAKGVGAKMTVCRWQSRIARQAVELVGKEEEEDLYFEGGHHSQEFVKLVVSLTSCKPIMNCTDTNTSNASRL